MRKVPTNNISLLALYLEWAAQETYRVLGQRRIALEATGDQTVSAAGEDYFPQHTLVEFEFGENTLASGEELQEFLSRANRHSLMMMRIWHRTDLLVPITVFRLPSLSTPSWTERVYLPH